MLAASVISLFRSNAEGKGLKLTLDLEPDMRWTGLEVIDLEAGLAGDKRGTVEFRAHWRQARERGVLHERSRFVSQSARWWYLDGVVG